MLRGVQGRSIVAVAAAVTVLVTSTFVPPTAQALDPPEPVLELTPGALPADTTVTLPRRFGGANRYETSAKVARHTGQARTRHLRLVRADRPLDAAVTPGSPMLYVPPRGPVPAAVSSAFRAVAPETVHVIGDERALPERQVSSLRGRERTRRWVLPTEALSLEFSAYPFFGEEQILQVPGVDVLAPAPVAEVAAAMATATRPAVVLPSSGSVDGVGRSSWILGLEGDVRFIGGAASYSAARQAQIVRYFAGGPNSPQPAARRIAEPDRYATAAVTAREAFPRGASRVYLAGGHADADAAIASAVSDGPVLLVPRCGVLPESVRQVIGQMGAREVVAIGGAGVVCDDMVRQAARVSSPRPRRNAQQVSVTGYAACLLTDGRVWCRHADIGPEFAELPGVQDVSSVRVTSNTPGVPVHVYALTPGGEMWRWLISAADGVGEPTRVDSLPGGIVSLAEGDGLPCATSPTGVACLVGEAWVPLPIGAPDQVALTGSSGESRTVATRHGGTTRIWQVDESGVRRLSARGVPSTVTDVTVPLYGPVRMRDAAGAVWDFEPLGEYAGRLRQLRVPLGDFVGGTACGVSAGTHLVCADSIVSTWTAPPGTRIVDADGETYRGGRLVVLDDGRVVDPDGQAGFVPGFGG